MHSDCAPRHPYLKLALVANTRDHGAEVPPGAERTFFIEKAIAVTRGEPVKSGERPPLKSVFPVQQPRSFRRSQLSEIATMKFLVSLKTDGVRYLLLLTRYVGEPRAVLIDRSMNVREIEVWANDEYFDDTLIDGELVTERNATGSISDVFLGFDLFVIKGASIRSRVYSDRISELFCILPTAECSIDDLDDITNAVAEGKKICAAPNSCLRIVTKVVMCATYTEHVWQMRRTCQHMNDGMIFTPDVGMEPHASIVVLKWKPLNTIDVMLVVCGGKAPSIWIRHATTTRVTSAIDMGDGLKLRFVLDSNVLLESLIQQGHVRFVVECACLVKGNVVFITPIRPRIDKDSPNHIHVVRETLFNVMENMDVSEIICSLNRADPFMPSSPTYDS